MSFSINQDILRFKVSEDNISIMESLESKNNFTNNKAGQVLSKSSIFSKQSG